jgi:hypothetical protein
MTEQDLEQFTLVWTAAQGIYNRTPAPMSVSIAFDALRRFSIEDIRRAISSHIGQDGQDGKFPLTPAHVVAFLEPDKNAQAARAWAKLLQGVSAAGAYASVVFDDPRIHVAVQQLGGWSRVCQWTEDELPYRCKDFQTLYNAVSPVDIVPARLTGLTDGNRATFNLPPSPAIYIGNPELCRAIESKGQALPGPSHVGRLLKRAEA